MAKQNATKGAKKGRRFNRPRSAAAKIRCSVRKEQRRKAQDAAHKANVARGFSAWDEVKARRAAKR